MINQVVKDKALYFSYEMDLTQSVQRILDKAAMTNQSDNHILASFPNSAEYTPQFAFNHGMLKELQQSMYIPFRTPCIYGFAYFKSFMLRNQKFDFALISRKDCRRPGKRFITRGIDKDGNPTNHVETETIVVKYE